MTYRNTLAARMMLSDLATAQGGYFTAKQAAGIGYGKRHLDYHVKARNIERAGHGLYRLPTIPLSEYDDLIRLALWSRNRHDEPQAVTSHESALGVHGLGELLPSLIHLTVPPSFRKNPPKGCVFHRVRLAVDEIEPREGFRVTTPLRTLLDVGEACSVSRDQLCRIIAQAFDEGLVRKTRLLAAMKGHAAEAKLSEATQNVR